MKKKDHALRLTPNNQLMYRYLMIATCVIAFAFQGWRTLYNNFAVDEVGLNALQNGVVQSIREIPGFLSLFVVYLLLLMKEHRVGLYSVALFGLSVCLVGYLDSFVGLIVTTFLLSTGMHFFETCNKSLTLQYFDQQQAPLVLAKQFSYKAITNVSVGIVMFFLCKWNLPYTILFTVLGIVVMGAVIYLSTLNPVKPLRTKQRTSMVFKRKYWLFYVVNFLSGARRQIFVVFAVFILVQRYHYSVMLVIGLFVVNNIISFFVSPVIGRMINRYSERHVLLAEYTAMLLVFSGYAFVDNAIVVGLLYLVDNIFYPCSMAINTYFQKIGDPEDIAPSMAMGFTINHISAVVIPVMGGALWVLDYRIPFILAIFLSLCSLFFVNKMKPLSALD